ncbi:MAG: hypothetical protein K2H34_00630 [Lachnospiraceae bacterium]|nr:hypothetical protein [Lachnospiraceae bacterium]
MRVVNGVVYIGLSVWFFLWVAAQRRKDCRWGSHILFMRKHISLLLVLAVANTISLAMTFEHQQTGILIEREDCGGAEKQVGIRLQMEDSTEEIQLAVQPVQLTKEECRQRMQQVFGYIDDHLKGENESLQRVEGNLDFTLDNQCYPFDVEFYPEHYALIDSDGNVSNEREELEALKYSDQDMEEGIATSVTVALCYGQEREEKIYEVIIFPKRESSIQKQFGEVQKQLQQAEEKGRYSEQLELPLQLGNIQITRMDDGKIMPIHVLLFGFLLAGLLLFREKEERQREKRYRLEQLKKSYPWFVNELVLLLGAGMQVKNIFALLTKENKENDYRSVLIKELQQTQRSIELGMAEEQAYYQLGRRLQLPCYIKLMTLLEQNVKRGIKGLTAVFEQEELNALEERKNIARRYGEEAGTKLLGPMILLLLVVMLIIMIPAFMSF